MNILIAGSSGFIGTALVSHLTQLGHRVVRLVRKNEVGEDECYWDPASGKVSNSALEGYDVIINLAGENLFASRWNKEIKKKIRDSRVNTARLLASKFSDLKRPPKLFVNASAIGYYGDRGTEELSEESGLGQGFLALVCRDWEAAAMEAKKSGVKTVMLRFGMVISPKGGALKQMLLPFKLGLGGVVGDGEQFISWITLADLISVILFLFDSTLEGPVNVVAPNPVTNREFTKTLGKVLNRPTFMTMPAFMARLAFGELADEVLLSSCRVHPARLAASGFKFQNPVLETALETLLTRSPEWE